MLCCFSDVCPLLFHAFMKCWCVVFIVVICCFSVVEVLSHMAPGQRPRNVHRPSSLQMLGLTARKVDKGAKGTSGK